MAKKAGAVKAGPVKGGAKGGPAKPAVETTLTDDEIQEIKEAFDLFDSDKSGTIDPSEVNAALASLGSDRSPTIVRLLNGLTELGGAISFDQFLAHVSTRLGNRTTREGIQRIFELFDESDKGTITVENLKRVAKELGESMTEEELEEAVSRVAVDKKAITPDDFYKILTKKVYA